MSYDIVGIGNAIVDIVNYKSFAFLEEHGLPHGSMQLVDEHTAEKLYELAGAATSCSGGSTANTMVGYGMLGGSAAFIGKVKQDQFGNIFKHDIDHIGVQFNSAMAEDGPSTARCIIFVTEEENQYGGPVHVERTMATYLGASTHITKADIDEELIASAKLLYFEGYLWDSPTAKEAVEYAMEIAKKYDTKIAFTLSDALCIQRHHAEFLHLVDNVADIVFCNEHEAEALFNEKSIRKILYRLTNACDMACVTRSSRGSYILHGDDIHTIDPVPVEDVYDVTGAGDMYAAGFLYGYLNGFSIDKAGKLGSLCASETIRYLGARPVSKLRGILEQV